jgi:UDP-N-acetylmuramate dehydrogenase
LLKQKNKSPNLKQIRRAIIKIRSRKLPNYKVIPNCGSFFKNPIISKKVAQKIKTQFPNLPTFEAVKGVKISAGFLIEQTGFKGQKIGKVEVYKNNALVLTNPNLAGFSDLILAKEIIQKKVLAKFGIFLEPEVNILR